MMTFYDLFTKHQLIICSTGTRKYESHVIKPADTRDNQDIYFIVTVEGKKADQAKKKILGMMQCIIFQSTL